MLPIFSPFYELLDTGTFELPEMANIYAAFASSTGSRASAST